MTIRTPLEKTIDLAGCIAGRAEAWRHFVLESAGIIQSAVRKSLEHRGAPQSESDDCVQDVYLRLLREECRLLRTFDPARSALSTWLTLIARTIVHERCKRTALPVNSRVATERLAAPQPTDADRPIELPLHALSQQQRQVLHLLFHENRTVEEAAKHLGIDPQTVRSAKHKALSRLRDELQSIRNATPPALRGDECLDSRLSPSESDRDAFPPPSLR